MKKYLIQLKLSPQFMSALITSPNDRSSFVAQVYDKLGGKLIHFNLISGTNRGFVIVSFDNIDSLHIYFHHAMATSGLEVISIEEFVTVTEHVELLTKHEEHLNHFKMPGEEMSGGGDRACNHIKTGPCHETMWAPS